MSSSKIKKKFINFGTTADDVNSRDIPAHFTPTNYTPDEVSTEGDDKVSAHLKGIDVVLGSIPEATPGDISETSFSAANNQSSAADVTGFAFANGVVRSFSALASVSIDATTDLFETFSISGIQKASSWELSVNSLGDDSGVIFSITNAGQLQYQSSNLAGFVSNTIKFRAIVTGV